MKKKYMVTVKVDAVLDVEVTAESIDDALRIGRDIDPNIFLRLKRPRKDSLIDWENTGVTSVYES